MDPTTLLTFLFQAPPEVRQVELLGSWDNFSQPYRMHHDRRRGTGFWSGCFKFENIIFDGTELQWTRPRSGGLKQGGTYWYYYRLDYDLEAYDDLLPHTSSCPLLPGQVLNVVEVPIEIVEPVSRCRSAGGDIAGTLASFPMTHTLDPGAKFAALEPPAVSKVHERSLSDFALGGRLERLPASAGHSVAMGVPGWPTESEVGASLDRRPSKRLKSSRGSSACSPRDCRSTSGNHADLAVGQAYNHRPGSLEQWAMPTFSGMANVPVVQPPSLEGDLYIAPNFADRSSVSGIRPASAHGQLHDHGDDTIIDCRPMSVQDVSCEYPQPEIVHTDDAHWEFLDHTTGNHPGHLEEHHFEEPINAASGPHSPAKLGQGSLDICSPTFSAATMSSSKDGLTTPFRLSSVAGYSRGATAYTDTEPELGQDPESNPNPDDEATLDEVADRLYSLDMSHNDDDGRPSPSPSPSPALDGEEEHEHHPSYELQRSRSVFSEYALPGPLPGGESVQSLGKLSLSSRGGGGLFLPEGLLQETIVGSMADDIFSELGYLGTSIA